MFVEIDGLRVHYRESGQGKPVLLLHGWGGSTKSFEPVHNFLEKHFRTVSIDLPGFGESAEPAQPWGVEEYTAIVEKFIRTAGLENPILMGHSHGGRVSIQYASRNSVRKLILVDSAGIKPKRGADYYLKIYSYKTAKKLAGLPGLRTFGEELLNRYRSKVGSSDYQNASPIMRQTLSKLVNSDLRHLLPQIKASTLLVWGDNDTATPLSDGQLMEKLIPDAGLVVLAGTGHFSYLEKLNEFLIIIDHFLKPDKEAKHG